jgi:putative addiction module component (TIGR02574 family)
MNKPDKIIAVKFTAEEKRIIDVRLDSYHQNPKAGSPWEDVCKKIVNRQ